MKKSIFLLMLLVAVASLSLVSCKDDDETSELTENETLLSAQPWIGEVIEHYQNGNLIETEDFTYCKLTFRTDFTYEMYYDDDLISEGTWELDTSTSQLAVILNSIDEGSYPIFVTELTEDTLVTEDTFYMNGVETLEVVRYTH